MRKVIGSSPISSTIQIPLAAVSGVLFVFLCKSAGRQTFSVRRPAFFCLCRAEVAHQDDGDLRARGVLLRRKVVHPALARSGDQSRRVGPRQGVIGPAADGSAVREAAEGRAPAGRNAAQACIAIQDRGDLLTRDIAVRLKFPAPIIIKLCVLSSPNILPISV